jgi:hypothetical protein
MNCVNFSKAFHDNMNALGLPAPNSLFSSLTTALANLGAMTVHHGDHMRCGHGKTERSNELGQR